MHNNGIINNIFNNDNNLNVNNEIIDKKDIVDNNKKYFNINYKNDVKKDSKDDENKGIVLGKNYGVNEIIFYLFFFIQIIVNLKYEKKLKFYQCFNYNIIFIYFYIFIIF